MTKVQTDCSRCRKPIDEGWTYCPQCGIFVVEGTSGPSPLSDRIRYVRHEPAGRQRRNAMVLLLARTSIVLSVVLVVGGGVMLFHPALVPALFKPPELPSGALPMRDGPPTPEPRAVAVMEFEWVTVPGGTFQFGRSGRTSEAELPEFQILKYEVTNGQWFQFLLEDEERLKAEGRYADAIPTNWEDGRPPAQLWDRPVVSISWFAARDFCNRYLSLQEGCEGARLPTGDEWEKAARGAEDDRPYPWGYEFFQTDEARPPRANTKEAGVGQPVSVFNYEKWDVSPYGVVGMAGNVMEFVSGEGFRGGCYDVDRYDAVISDETHFAAGAKFTWAFVGFRPARTPPEKR